MRRRSRSRPSDIDGLLYDFLTELIVLKDVDSLLFKDFKLHVSQRRASSLVCEMRGETDRQGAAPARNDVKAVTMHMFGVKQQGGGWKATVVLDI